MQPYLLTAIGLCAIIIIILLQLQKKKQRQLADLQFLFDESTRQANNEAERVKSEHVKEIESLNQTLKEKQMVHDHYFVTSSAQLKILRENYQPIIDLDHAISEREKETARLEQIITELNEKYKRGIDLHRKLETEINLFKDTLDIRESGLYEPVFNYDSTEQYKLLLEHNYQNQKYYIQSGQAIVCHTNWSVGNSESEGKKMIDKYQKLMLYAFNGEADYLISKVKWNNAARTKERIIKEFENINKLGKVQTIEITKGYLDLKLEAFHLTYELEQKCYEEKEEQRRIREQMREEEKAQKELERAKKDAEDEERQFQKALEKATKELDHASQAEVDTLNNEVRALQEKLAEAQAKKERAISMAQLTRVGYIYVISNIGSFGEDIFKIGMTRRLDPQDRIRELGDASVPFCFDVHAIIYSEDAPQLEYEFHQRFSDKRLNRINNRKEFFRATIDEIEGFVKEHSNADIQFTKICEAREYRETMSLLERLKVSVSEEIKNEKFPTSLI